MRLGDDGAPRVAVAFGGSGSQTLAPSVAAGELSAALPAPRSAFALFSASFTLFFCLSLGVAAIPIGADLAAAIRASPGCPRDEAEKTDLESC
jgi:hypothetical protein